MRSIRVVLVDDHPVVLAGVRALTELSAGIEVIGEATNGADALGLIETLTPDVAVIDVTLPDMSGLELAKRLRIASPSTRLLVLTVHENRAYVHPLLQAGVRGYLLKHTAAEDLAPAIRAVATGGVYLDASVVETTLMSGGAGEREGATPEEVGDLSPRERDVLRFIAQGYTNKQIAAELDISIKSVETYKSRATTKLKLRTRVEIVRFAAAQGWIGKIEDPSSD